MDAGSTCSQGCWLCNLVKLLGTNMGSSLGQNGNKDGINCERSSFLLNLEDYLTSEVFKDVDENASDDVFNFVEQMNNVLRNMLYDFGDESETQLEVDGGSRKNKRKTTGSNIGSTYSLDESSDQTSDVSQKKKRTSTGSNFRSTSSRSETNSDQTSDVSQKKKRTSTGSNFRSTSSRSETNSDQVGEGSRKKKRQTTSSNIGSTYSSDEISDQENQTRKRPTTVSNFGSTPSHTETSSDQVGEGSRKNKSRTTGSNIGSKLSHSETSSDQADAAMSEKECAMDNRIKAKKIGRYNIPIGLLEEAPKELLRREVKVEFVKKMDAKEAYEVIPVLLIGSRETFSPNFSHFYLLGGNHLTAALRGTVETICCEVYAELTAVEALRVASWHNNIQNFTLPPTLQDNLIMFRRMLYTSCNLPDTAEPGQMTIEFRRNCILALGKRLETDTAKERHQRQAMGPILQMATYPNKCWELLMSVMTNYEQDHGIPLEQTYFHSLQGLTDDEKYEILLKCENQEIKPRDMPKLAQAIKKERLVKEKICSFLDVTNYREAKCMYPHIQEEDVQAFVDDKTMKFKKELPVEFRKWMARIAANKGKQCTFFAELGQENKVMVLGRDNAQQHFPASQITFLER
ncbi:uncharacterized protein [Amphiura filiformis]|uniref:uncharacterized protein n=1 Tax=Amphiura filiformis TaxID=82378 RepID=UPI003B20C940